jgi:hypothetical protein
MVFCAPIRGKIVTDAWGESFIINNVSNGFGLNIPVNQVTRNLRPYRPKVYPTHACLRVLSELAISFLAQFGATVVFGLTSSQCLG